MAQANPESARTYRENFVAGASADRYDAHVYAPDSWSTLLWRIEQECLGRLMGRTEFVPTRRHYLDFACGTGRLTEYLSPHFERSTGLDISPAMLDRAKRRAPSTDFVRADITRDDYHLVEPADLITAFRFILNAEASDRKYALKWMHAQLRDEDSRVIVNNHANLWTHKALPNFMRRIATPRRDLLTGNVLSHRSVVRMVDDAGFAVEQVHGSGILGAKALKLIPYERLESLQRRAASIPWLAKFGENQIYVLAPR